MAELTGEHWRIIVGDVFEGLRSLAPKSIHEVVTSPPYWGLRNYGFEGQIGSEKSPDEFVDVMVRVFREVRRVLRDDGVLFVNLGDSYADDSKWGGTTGGKHVKALHGEAVGRLKRTTGISAGNKIGIPWRVALALQVDGWILRQDIVWAKPSPMPESVNGWRWVKCRIKVDGTGLTQETHPSNSGEGSMKSRSGVFGSNNGTVQREDKAKFVPCPGCDKCRDNGGMVLRKGSWRPTTSHEFIFMFVKNSFYFCDGDGSKEAAVKGAAGSRFDKGKTVDRDGEERSQEGKRESDGSEARNQRSVWRIPPEGFKGAHFATYPTELVRLCLVSATSRGGCCSVCGSQYAPVVASKRSATRP